MAEADIRAAIETYAAAWVRGDLAAIVGCYHDEFTLHYFGDNALAGIHSGKAAALTALASFSQKSRRRLMAVTATMAGADRGAVIAREMLTHNEREIEVERLLVYAVRDGLLAECWVYDQDQRLIDAIIDGSASVER